MATARRKHILEKWGRSGAIRVDTSFFPVLLVKPSEALQKHFIIVSGTSNSGTLGCQTFEEFRLVVAAGCGLSHWTAEAELVRGSIPAGIAALGPPGMA
eukprot:s1614_g6.t1